MKGAFQVPWFSRCSDIQTDPELSIRVHSTKTSMSISVLDIMFSGRYFLFGYLDLECSALVFLPKAFLLVIYPWRTFSYVESRV